MNKKYIGLAGWSIPKSEQARFGDGASLLERYATVLNAVEINSSFYRSHRLKTYMRWHDSVPLDFRFSVKLPKQMTHIQKLASCNGLRQFLDEIAGLDTKLGAILVQLPPSLAFDEPRVKNFFASFRAAHSGRIVCEPRHPSWFGDAAARTLASMEVSFVGADPAPFHKTQEKTVQAKTVQEKTRTAPKELRGLQYLRLHGSPKMYYSSYSHEFISTVAEQLRSAKGEVWCIFDNTAAGAAVGNAFTLHQFLSQ